MSFRVAKRFHGFGQIGDTIVEVLLALAVLGLVLGSSAILVNRNSRSLQSTQEHSAGLRIAQSQLEYVRAYVASAVGEAAIKKPSSDIYKNPGFCMAKEAGTYIPKIADSTQTACVVSGTGAATTQEPKYTILGKMNKNSDSYDAKVTVTWTRLGGGTDRVTLTYRTYDRLTPLAGATLFCADNEDGTPPNCTPKVCGAYYTGVWPACVLKIPSAVQISPNSKTYSTLHLAGSDGATQVFTVTLPAASPAPTTIASFTVTNSSYFRITPGDDGCTGKTLNPGQSCSVRVQFLPVSIVNRFSNSGVKTATINVSQAVLSNTITASLSGKAVSDRLGPGDIMRGDDRLYSYNASCRNDVESCSIWLVMQSGDGNFVLYTPSSGGLWATMVFPGAGAYAYMQETDGDFVIYNAGGTPYWATWWAPPNGLSETYSYGDWLWVYPDNHGVVLMRSWPSGGGAHWIYYQ